MIKKQFGKDANEDKKENYRKLRNFYLVGKG